MMMTVDIAAATRCPSECGDGGGERLSLGGGAYACDAASRGHGQLYSGDDTHDRRTVGEENNNAYTDIIPV